MLNKKSLLEKVIAKVNEKEKYSDILDAISKNKNEYKELIPKIKEKIKKSNLPVYAWALEEDVLSNLTGWLGFINEYLEPADIKKLNDNVTYQEAEYLEGQLYMSGGLAGLDDFLVEMATYPIKFEGTKEDFIKELKDHI